MAPAQHVYIHVPHTKQLYHHLYILIFRFSEITTQSLSLVLFAFLFALIPHFYLFIMP